MREVTQSELVVTYPPWETIDQGSPQESELFRTRILRLLDFHPSLPTDRGSIGEAGPTDLDRATTRADNVPIVP